MTQKIKTTLWDGKPISTPGLYAKISMTDYHSARACDGPAVSSSDLRTLFTKSPAHMFLGWSGNPNRIREDKKQFILGRAVHVLMLGEAGFDKLFAVEPVEYPDRYGVLKPWHNGATYCKGWTAAQHAEGRAVLTEDDVAAIRGMAASLSLHPIIRVGALNGMIERSIFFKDKPTGLWVKSRPDAIPSSSVDFVDLKTTTSVLWPDLQRTIAEFGYHQQGALVRRAAKEVLDVDNPTFTLVFVEKTPPYCVRIVTLKDNDLDRGDKQNRAALDTVARCIDSGHWPGPGGEREDAEHIELPQWAQTQIDDKLSYRVS